ncbi:hypothetical protein PPEP_a2919 [Pseudoalteromonas peptidolytica F12-50-A1]|uniref:Uncharacterized protein n=1 Tax=Pseudoalteromonas peptidolytica F12-50-A1 TaxID=1315280 RepID=A0A8I0MWS6_9GAMM|nr:hypothetical protein [Pseudoalteromonas peptidolytica F12-50-A1]
MPVLLNMNLLSGSANCSVILFSNKVKMGLIDWRFEQKGGLLKPL